LDSVAGLSDQAIARDHGVNRNTVILCIRKCLRFGVPKHGSWLNLVENMFSKMARSMLREIRVHSKQELIERIHLYFQEVNAAPVVFRWKYKMDEVSID
jgi:transposase